MSSIYMHIIGIEGNVTAKNYEGWIRLSSLTQRNTRNNAMKVGKMADREGSAPDFSEIEITKLYDCASNGLFQKSCVANAIPQVSIHALSNQTDITPYFKMVLNDVLISEHVLHLNGNSRALETFQISFSKIQLTYVEFDAGKKPTAPNIVGYDLAKATLV